MPETIKIEMISRHYGNPMVGYVSIGKTHKLVACKFNRLTFQFNVEVYVKDCDVCLVLNAARHKPYSDLQALLILTYRWKVLSIHFVTGLPILTNWKGELYDSILIIVN